MSQAKGRKPSRVSKGDSANPRLSKARIVQVARSFDPRDLTMQAVADELGVDRKALNYHVTDKKGLESLVAANVFESNFLKYFSDNLEARKDADEWVRHLAAWSYAAKDGLVSSGMLTNYYVLGSDNPDIFKPSERVLWSLIRAGFNTLTASRALVMATRLAMGVGRDIVLENVFGEHPQGPEVRKLLDRAIESGEYPALTGMIQSRVNGADDVERQFVFELETMIAGLRSQLGA